MKPRFRPSLADTLRGNQKAMDFYQAISARPDAKRIDVGATEKRAYTKRAPGPESYVLKAVGELLAKHPLVAIAIRINSGAAMRETADGKQVPIRFWRMIKGGEITITDYIGQLRDGRALALECKPPAWRRTTYGERGAREDAQDAYMHLVRKHGGVAGFVRSVDEAVEVLGGWGR